MGLGGISIWQLLIILVIVALIFGTKKLRGIGGDLGGAVKGFKSALDKDEIESKENEIDSESDAQEAETVDSESK